MIDDKLWIDAAIALSGDPNIHLRFRHPAIREFNGLAFKKDGVNTIDIDPVKSDMGMVEILAHECAHVRDGHVEDFEALSKTPGKVLDIDASGPPNSVSLGVGEWSYKNAPLNVKFEYEAEMQTVAWMNYAEKHASEYSVHRPEAERYLLALSKWDPEPEQLETWKQHQIELADTFQRKFGKRGLKNVKSKK
jgi:hypothetical protein